MSVEMVERRMNAEKITITTAITISPIHPPIHHPSQSSPLLAVLCRERTHVCL
jgi:hypothetical protein